MKNLIILTIAVIALISCSNYSGDRKPNLEKVEFPSWETEVLKECFLVRPLHIKSGSTDAYGTLLSSDEWYFFRKENEGYLLPAKVRYGDDYTFIKKIAKQDTMAIIDTFNPNLISGAKSFQGLSGVSQVEILCLKEGIITPVEGPHGEMYPEISYKK